MFLAAVAFLVGHVLLHAMPALPACSPWVSIESGVGATFLCLTRVPRLRVTACVGLALLLGFSWAWWHATLRISERWPTLQSGTDVELQGFVASIVEKREDGLRFRFDVTDSKVAMPRHIELSWYEAIDSPQPGELWHLRARLRSPHGFANPGGYDYEAQLLRDDVGATGYIRDADSNRRLAAPHWSYAVLRVRAWLAARLAAALPGSRMLGIVQGLAIGDTTNMERDQWRVFANTGTTHLMAISGMHIGMVAMLSAFFAGRVARRCSLQSTRISVAQVHAIAGMIAALGYSALAGLSVPTQRTLIMLCVYFGSRLLRREVTVVNGLSIALLAVLIVDPFAPLAPGFWLSFGAVAALFLAGSGRVGNRSKAREYFRAQAVVTVGLAPLLIGTFGSFSLIAPLVNLFAIPFFTLLIVPLVLAATLLLIFSTTLGGMFLRLPVNILELSWPILESASRLPFAIWPLPHAPWWAFALFVVGACVLLAPGMFFTRLAGALLCLPALCWQPARPSPGDFELTLLDVGQGLAVAIRTAAHVAVYDTGPNFRGGRDTGELVVVPFLHSLGVRSLDAVLISHGDADHVGGLQSLLTAVPARRLLFGPSVTPIIGSEICASGQHWQWDGVDFDIVYPDANEVAPRRVGKRRNNTSCVLLVRGAGGGALLTGDIEAPAEQRMDEAHQLKKVDIVIVPHHGSRTSSSASLVSATAPRYALVSAGFGNRFGFPNPDIVARWVESGADVLQTATDGAITISVARGGVLQPHSYRDDDRRYWRQ